VILSDEIYSRNIYGERFESITQFEELRDRIILVDGFSKAYAMTGWRLGYSIAPPQDRARRDAAREQHVCVRVDVHPEGRHRRADRTRRAGRGDERDLPHARDA
jgi:aspartate/methionine/tyrosine aminotransferase